jgi:hypothetical protein
MFKAFPMTRSIVSETIKPLPIPVGGQLKAFHLLGSRMVGSSQNDVEKSLKGISTKVPKAIGSAGQKASISVNGAITVPNRGAEITVKLSGTLSAVVCAD